MSAWTAPITWASGAVLTAAQMNTEVRDHHIWVKAALDLLTASTASDTGDSTYLKVLRATSTAPGAEMWVTGDAKARLSLRPAGIYFGNGTDDSVCALGLGSAIGRLELAGTNPQFAVTQGAGGAARNLIWSWITGDSYPRVALGLAAADRGRLTWGSGADVEDVTIERSAAGDLTMTGQFVNLDVTTSYKQGSTQVVGSRKTGYVNQNGTADRGSAYATSTITLEELAERVKAIQDDLMTHGLLGA